jgi:molybdopterin molybdotransferase
MLPFSEALKKIMEQCHALPVTTLPLNKLNGSVTAEAIKTILPLPRFDNSAVDGYGVKFADLNTATEETPVKLKIVGEIAAGQSADFELDQTGTALRIFTGARVPESVEAVVMREYCHENDGYVHIDCEVQKGANIRIRGAEFAQGAEVIKARTRITPPVVGLLATLGHANFAVHAKPKVSLVITGDELISPGLPLADSQIYDSNSFALEAALTDLGISECKKFYARDNREQTREAFRLAFLASDVVLSSGGVSVGDKDYVKEILEELSVETIFWRIAMKPGKPVFFGTYKKSGNHSRGLVFGLPGNPVSVLVTYHQLVKPALLSLMGLKEKTNQNQTMVLKGVLKKKAGRLDFIRAKIQVNSDGVSAAIPSSKQDSHMMTGLTGADCLIHFDIDAEELHDGQKITSTPINWHG